eukprot:GGOE01045117.1.p1 GENE.GGOE01045117.1~~GGOE01045117.1.p1  ORF type:complete len:1811 (-),score=378.43 GGOE01045117.1:279-5711(-)
MAASSSKSNIPPGQSLDLRTLLVDAKDKVLEALTDALRAGEPLPQAPEVSDNIGPKAHIRYSVLNTINEILSETIHAIPAVPEDDPDSLTLQAVEGDPADADRLKREVAYLKQCNRQAAERLKEREECYEALLKRLTFHDAILNLLKGRLYHELCLLKEELFRTRSGFSERSDAFLHDILMLVDTEAMLDLVKDDERMAAMLRQEAQEAGEESVVAPSPSLKAPLKVNRELEGLKDQYRRQRALLDNGFKKGITEDELELQIQAAAAALNQASAQELAALTESHQEAKQQLKARLAELNEGLEATLAAEAEAMQSEGRRETEALQGTIKRLQTKVEVAEVEAQVALQKQRQLEQEHARRISERDAMNLTAAQRDLQTQCIEEAAALKQRLEELTAMQARAEEALARKRESSKTIGDILQRTLAAWRESRDVTAAAEQELGQVRSKFLPVYETLRQCEHDSTAALRRLESLLRLCHSLALPAPLLLPAGIDLGLNDEELVRFEFLQMLHRSTEGDDSQVALQRARSVLREVNSQAEEYANQFRALDQQVGERQQQLLVYGQRVKDVHEMLRQLLSAAERIPTPNLYSRLLAYVETLRLRSELWSQSLGMEGNPTGDTALLRGIGEGLAHEFAEFIARDPKVHRERPKFNLDFSKLRQASGVVDVAPDADPHDGHQYGFPAGLVGHNYPRRRYRQHPMAVEQEPTTPTPPRTPDAALVVPPQLLSQPPLLAPPDAGMLYPQHLLRRVSEVYGGSEAQSYRHGIEEVAQQAGAVQATIWATEYAAGHFPRALSSWASRQPSMATAPPDVNEADSMEAAPSVGGDMREDGPVLQRSESPRQPLPSRPADPVAQTSLSRPPSAPARTQGTGHSVADSHAAMVPQSEDSTPVSANRPVPSPAAPTERPPSAPSMPQSSSPYLDLLQEISNCYGEGEAEAYRLGIEEVAQQAGAVQATIWATEYAADHFPDALTTWASHQHSLAVAPAGDNVVDSAEISPLPSGDICQDGPVSQRSEGPRQPLPSRPGSAAGPVAQTSLKVVSRPPSGPLRIATGRSVADSPAESADRPAPSPAAPTGRPPSAPPISLPTHLLPSLHSAPVHTSEEEPVALVAKVDVEQPPPLHRRSSAASEGHGQMHLPKIGSNTAGPAKSPVLPRVGTIPMPDVPLPQPEGSRPSSAQHRGNQQPSFSRGTPPPTTTTTTTAASTTAGLESGGGNTVPRPMSAALRSNGSAANASEDIVGAHSHPTTSPPATTSVSVPPPTSGDLETGESATTKPPLWDTGADAEQWVATFDEWVKLCLEAGAADASLQQELASAREEMSTLLRLKFEAEHQGRWEEAQGILSTIRRAEGLLAALYPALARLSPAVGGSPPAAALHQPVVGILLAATGEQRPPSGSHRLQGRRDANRVEVARWYGLVPPSPEPRPLCSATSIRPAVSGNAVAALHTNGCTVPPFDALAAAGNLLSTPGGSPQPRQPSPHRTPRRIEPTNRTSATALGDLLEALADIDSRCTTLEEAKPHWLALERQMVQQPIWVRLETRTWLIHAKMAFQQRMAQKEVAGRTLDVMVWADKGVPVNALPAPPSPPDSEVGSAANLVRLKSGRPQTACAAQHRPVVAMRPASAPSLVHMSAVRVGRCAAPPEEDNALSDVSSNSTTEGAGARFTVVQSAPARPIRPFLPSWPMRTALRRTVPKRADPYLSPPVTHARASPKRTLKGMQMRADPLDQLQTLLGSLDPLQDFRQCEKVVEPHILRGDDNGRGLSWEARTILCHAKAASDEVVLPSCFAHSVPFCLPGSHSTLVRLARPGTGQQRLEAR